MGSSASRRRASPGDDGVQGSFTSSSSAGEDLTPPALICRLGRSSADPLRPLPRPTLRSRLRSGPAPGGSAAAVPMAKPDGGAAAAAALPAERSACSLRTCMHGGCGQGPGALH